LISGLLAIPAVVMLVGAAEAGDSTIAALTYGTSMSLLLIVSGTYHTPYWPEKARARWQRLDRSMIFMLLGGSYTPFLLGVGGRSVTVFLPIIWLLTLGGIIRTVFFPGGRRWLTVLTYIAMGWLSIPLLPGWIQYFGSQVVGLIAVGGAIYSLGAVVYAKRWPNPWPLTFGYHEIFHVAVVLGCICHYWAVWQVVV
jgi:hemolysin III